MMDAAADTPGFRALVALAVTLVGSQGKLAEKIGRSQQQVSNLCNTARTISAEDALAIERATEGVVSKSELRPDLWPGAETQRTESAA